MVKRGEAQGLTHMNWNNVVVRIMYSYDAISKSINPAGLLKIELTSAQIKALTAFGDREERTMTELSQTLSVTLPTVTAMVDRLIHGSLVERVRDAKDRRVVRVRLTPSGKEMLSNLMVIRRVELERILKSLSTQELELFLTSIENVANLLAKARGALTEETRGAAS